MNSGDVGSFDTFYHSEKRSDVFIIGESHRREALRTYAKKFTKPRVVMRTTYKAELLMECDECDECGDYTNTDNMRSEWSDEMASGVFNTFSNAGVLAFDMCVECETCAHIIRFSNDLDALKADKQEGRLRFGKWKATDQVVLVKEPFQYPKSDWGYSHRKHYNASK